MTSDDEIKAAIKSYLAEGKTDLFVFSGPIDLASADQLIDLIIEKPQRQPRASLFLTTYGGDMHSAYRMTRCLRAAYDNLVILIVGPCKSAGTLVAIGATQLAFARTGELGPIDVQMTKPDEILPLSSGLDAFQGLAILTSHAFRTFEDYMLTITNKSVGSVSTKTASHIASELVTGIFKPIAEQIDPLRLGEAQRVITISTEYGKRIGDKNLKANALESLIERYPSHGFVIDMEEARKLFKEVRDLTDNEARVAKLLRNTLRYPAKEAVIADLGETIAKESDDDQTTNGSTENPERVDWGSEGAPGKAPNAEPGHAPRVAKLRR